MDILVSPGDLRNVPSLWSVFPTSRQKVVSVFGLLEASENDNPLEVWKRYPSEAVRQVALQRVPALALWSSSVACA